jgi:imidazole glycerol-phosphate synthase subunit HisH
MRVTLFDYGAGNLHSLAKALRGERRDVRLESDPIAALETDVLVLPGVGAFEPAARALAGGLGAMRAAMARGLPCLGICLGMQLLFDSSEEGTGSGLGVFAGSVTRLRTLRIPQIGWNSIDEHVDPLFGASGLEIAYYANSFVCRPRDESVVTAWSTHDGDRFPAAVRSGDVVGVQFHPEKSSARGLAFVHEYLNGLPNQ